MSGDGDASTIEDEVSVKSSEIECEHVSGRSHSDFPKTTSGFLGQQGKNCGQTMEVFNEECG